jgi:hypothetical protein
MNITNLLLLEKLYHLGSVLEKDAEYIMLDPWEFKSHDLVQVQKAARKISEFVGLPNLTFVINYCKQNQGVGGHIELNNNSNEGVFIEIDEKFKNEYEIVLAILAHEICHKLIHINRLTQIGYENEILTDVATVYSGLGKLSLNGCELQKSSSSTVYHGNSYTTTTTTNTQQVGYLNRSQFAFLYKAVCKMRRIPKRNMMKKLNYSASAVLNSIKFNPSGELYHNEYAVSEVPKTLKTNYERLQIKSASNIKAIKLLDNSLKEALKSDNDIHFRIKSTIDSFSPKIRNSNNIESLIFLKNLILFEELNFISSKFSDQEKEIVKQNSFLVSWLKDLSSIHTKPDIEIKSRDFLYLIDCPICKNRMRLNQDKLAKIKCTKCNYSFIVDNIPDQNNNLKRSKTRLLMRKLKEFVAILRE